MIKRRNTQSKSEILKVLQDSKSAMSHDMVQSELVSNIDRATIYRVLNRFCEDGLTHRIIGDDGKQYFALCTKCLDKNHKHNHFHFRCLKCGTVKCLEAEISTVLPRGYVAESFNAVISGQCESCSTLKD